MQILKIPKEQLGNKVLFPRTQLKGLTCTEAEKPKKEDFKIVTQQVEGMGDVTLIEQTTSPRHVFQLFKTESEEVFDDYLGKLLGKKRLKRTKETFNSAKFLLLQNASLSWVGIT